MFAATAAVVLAGPMTACSRPGGAQGQVTAEAVTLSDSQAEQALKVLAEAPSHGFPPAAFPVDGLEDQLKSDEAGTRTAAQRRLASELVSYARAMHGFAIPKGAMDPNWGMRSSAKYDAAAELRAAVAQDKMQEWLASLPPAAPQYEALRKGYATYLKIADDGGWPAVPTGPALKLGAGGPRVAALRKRLGFEDAAVAQAAPDAPYDAALGQAVAAFQTRHGLPATGAVDAHTLAALNVPAIARAAQIRANLERWRWAPRETPPTRIEVNSAAGLFDMYVDGQPAMHMLVAAGKPGDETPILTSKIHTVVLNPSWNVPKEIAEKEILPKGEAYLASHNFVQEGDRLVQKPGDGNSLGQVKFQFDNAYAVYLHDTPAKAAFTRPQRQVSHGCVRLEKAIDLAKFVLGRDSGMPPEQVDEDLADADTHAIALKTQIPVAIYYWTAWVDGDQVAFRDDVYGWDEAVLRQLDAALGRRT
ncbi:L,D-transpeptidase family protein [Phenylobacterium soli]|uniref:Murein L,D-transpeptidase n=1 Tax=Phenylobacterium soli TaxID=2170551 RepID=A0A328A9D3_9CAUL|nr:L,D-transpeptidase family protein [Phenylobacterium soli]RAK51115.1 murein L,D-transpeptidase [Phenylobacterium soli]